MKEWYRHLQTILDEIDAHILSRRDEAVTLDALSRRLGYSSYHFSHRFRELSGVSFRGYVRERRLALALRQLQSTEKSILEIALEFGFSSHEAFSRAFRKAYGVTPSSYRRHPTPVVLRTLIRPFDCYLMEKGECGMYETNDPIKTYFVTIPAHKFLHIRNYESIGYFDFWQKQSLIPGQDCETICGLLQSIPGKLDDVGGTEADSSSGQIMAFLNTPSGRLCSWGIPLAECYGVRLPADYDGEIPAQMQLMDVPEGEYIVFEHGPFDFETQNAAVEQKIEEAMKTFDYAAAGRCLDLTENRVFYFFHDQNRFWKYIRPVRRCD